MILTCKKGRCENGSNRKRQMKKRYLYVKDFIEYVQKETD